MYQREPDYYYNTRPTGLEKLKDMDNWRVSEEDIDIRGWTLVDRDGNGFGEVQDFLVDTETHEAVFATVSYGGTMGIGGKRALIPLDRIHLDRDKKHAIFEGMADHVKNSPEYKEDTHDYGHYYDYWSGTRAEAAPTAYEGREVTTGRERVIPETEEHLEARKVEEEVGEVEIHKEVESHMETVREPVKKTRIHVMRRHVEPGREPAPGEHVLREGETLEIPIVEEHLEVEKRAEVTGEVVIRPETYTEEETKTAEVKKEHVEVEAHGDVELEEEEEEERTRHQGY